jgi:hypothetical protein
MAADTHQAEAANIVSQGLRREQQRLRSLSRFVNLDADLHLGSDYVDRLGAGLADAAKGLLQIVSDGSTPRAADTRVPVRNPEVKGPLAPDGDWVMEKAGAAAATIAVARVARSDDVTYEIVNFIDGSRSVSEIRDAVSAEFEPIELKAVAEYLDLLARTGAVRFKP